MYIIIIINANTQYRHQQVFNYNYGQDAYRARAHTHTHAHAHARTHARTRTRAYTHTHTRTRTVQTDRGKVQCCLTQIFWEAKYADFAFEGRGSSGVSDVLKETVEGEVWESAKAMGFAAEALELEHACAVLNRLSWLHWRHHSTNQWPVSQWFVLWCRHCNHHKWLAPQKITKCWWS